MSPAKDAEQLASEAADAVRGILAQAEEKAAEIIREAEAKAASVRDMAEAEAASIRERGENEARAQIEAAKRALDELGGTLAAAASSALPKSDPEPAGPQEDPVGAPEAPTSPPAEGGLSGGANGDDAGERLVAMKLAVEGKDRASIEAELTEKFGSADRSTLLDDVLSRVPR